MAEETKSAPVKTETTKIAPVKTETSAPSGAATAPAADAKNGKGDAPRNCFSDKFRSNFGSIDWSK